MESMIPPLPMITVPESFTFAERLRADSIRSPIVLTNEIVMPMNIASKIEKRAPIEGILTIQSILIITEDTKPPMNPARLLLGLTENRFLFPFPNHIPNTYANVSFPKTSKNNMSNKKVVCSNISN